MAVHLTHRQALAAGPAGVAAVVAGRGRAGPVRPPAPAPPPPRPGDRPWPGRRPRLVDGRGGALRLAEAHPERLAAAAAASPAVAPSGRLNGLPVKIDCGDNDAFADATRALAATLPTATVAVTRGCHDGLFWQHQAPAQLRFLGASCS